MPGGRGAAALERMPEVVSAPGVMLGLIIKSQLRYYVLKSLTRVYDKMLVMYASLR